MITKALGVSIALVVVLTALGGCSAGGQPIATGGTPSNTSAPSLPTARPAAISTPAQQATVTSQAAPETTSLAPSTVVSPTVAAADWMMVYDELAAEHHRDALMCAAAPMPTPEPCPRPTSQIGVTELKQEIRIELILDASGSMLAPLDGQTKFEIAKQALSRFVATFPTEAHVGLRVYGHIGTNQEQDKPLSCDASQLILPVSPVDPASIQQALDAIQPSGWTPIATSLTRAADDFASVDPATTTTFVYLVSDGIETCDGDPIAAARALHDSPRQTVVSVIGFDVDPVAAQQLRDTAAAGGGSYYEARSTVELERVFQETIDWEGWKRYYYCTNERWHVYTVQVFRSEDDRHRCVRDAANEEYAAIRAAVESDPSYAEVRRQVIEQAHLVRETRINDSRAERERKIAEAEGQERETSSTAEAERRQEAPEVTGTSD